MQMLESEEFNNWKWQLSHRLTTREQLEAILELSEAERAALSGAAGLPFAITPYYAGLLKEPAIRKTMIPVTAEQLLAAGELEDPLGEEAHRAAPHLIHTYPDKALFLVTLFCSSYCRYCTRSRVVGRGAGGGLSAFAADFDYLRAHPGIRDLLISGGDPLTLTDTVLDRLLTELRAISHLETIRIGSKVPAVLPMRITDRLCEMLRRHEVWLSLHFTHPAELTDETRAACRRLSDAGVAMVSQTVLLAGVNDDYSVLRELFYGLLKVNVKPYYLLQCDPVRGSARFRTPVERGIELIQSLHGTMSGLAVPQYVIDAPGGGGKVPILSAAQIRREGDEVVLLNYEGKAFRYPDPQPVSGAL
jgi:lysine 2,3-aminomutase